MLGQRANRVLCAKTLHDFWCQMNHKCASPRPKKRSGYRQVLCGSSAVVLFLFERMVFSVSTLRILAREPYSASISPSFDTSL